jgi:hypothetical protein
MKKPRLTPGLVLDAARLALRLLAALTGLVALLAALAGLGLILLAGFLSAALLLARILVRVVH